MTEPSKAVQRWGDAQQYISEPMPKDAVLGPKVTLMNATPDPLGTIAAICGIYKGEIFRSLREVTDDQRRQVLEDMTKTVLNGPLEAANFVFLIEGVSRDFTHQAVRMRNSFFAQESLRFAVKEDAAKEIPLPPYLSNTKGDEPPGAEDSVVEYLRNIWDTSIRDSTQSYQVLVNNGMPAEEARKLLPHATTTRYWWAVNLRGLLGEAGKRTCTQAQFDWRIVFAGIAMALREYGDNLDISSEHGPDVRWQFNLIADMIRPVCFQEGKCGFMAQFDRGCSIRERVDQNEKAGRPSSEWGERGTYPDGMVYRDIEPIHNYEWAADPGAART
jgi:flavin-dependent thymidylate synthase